ncbi:MAG: hypothetical protein ACP5XB_17145 [Isosphaeraceae bacterium]
MLGGLCKAMGALAASGLVALALGPAVVRGDDTSFFGRLFRLGGNSSSSSSSSFPSTPGSTGRSGSAGNRASSGYGDIGSGGTFIPPAAPNRGPSPTPTGGPISPTGPSTPDLAGSSNAAMHLTPRARMTSAVTSADPLVTRMALGRSNDGSQFGMFLQVFADGTVIDSEGVHRLGSAEIRPLYEAVQSGELTHLRGHCGTPSNDFTEYVHVIVFERRMGRLQAHSFSYGGNPQGCESGLRTLHAALENIQVKLSRQPGASSTPVGAATAPAPVPGPAQGPLPVATGSEAAPPLPDPGAGPGSPSGAVIPLSPLPPR